MKNLLAVISYWALLKIKRPTLFGSSMVRGTRTRNPENVPIVTRNKFPRPDSKLSSQENTSQKEFEL